VNKLTRKNKSLKKKSGALIATYQDRKLSWKDFFLLFVPSAAAVLTPILMGMDRKQFALENFGPAAAQAWAKPWYTLSAVALIPFLALVLLRIRQSNRFVKLYKNGLFIHSTSRKKIFFFWDQIEGVTQRTLDKTFFGKVISRKNFVSIHSSDGSATIIDSQIKNTEELGNRIKAKVYPRLLGEYRTSFYNGENVDFGFISMDQRSVTLKDKTYSWDQITQIEAKNGFVKFALENNHKKKISLKKVPNVEIFIQLLSEGANS
jgi:hypothetical protein